MKGLVVFFLALSAVAGDPSSRSDSAAKTEKDLAGPYTREELREKRLPWLENGEVAEKKRLAGDATTKPGLKKLAERLRGVDIEVYFGSWCPDTHDQFPVLLASLDASGAKPKSIRYFAVDRRKTYPGFTNPRQVERIPTFVFLRDGKEIGRFVETPKKSVVEDVLGILEGKSERVR